MSATTQDCASILHLSAVVEGDLLVTVASRVLIVLPHLIRRLPLSEDKLVVVGVHLCNVVS